jgi:hypothetical protein
VNTSSPNHENEKVLPHQEQGESSRQVEDLSTRKKHDVSGFIMAAQEADMRLPPDEYFPSQYGITSFGGPNYSNVHGYLPTHVPGSTSSGLPLPSNVSEQSGEPIAKSQHNARRSVHFDDADEGSRSFLSTLYSTFRASRHAPRRRTNEDLAALKSVLKVKRNNASSNGSVAEAVPVVRDNGKSATSSDNRPNENARPVESST